MIFSMDTYVLRDRVGDENAIKLLKNAGFNGIDYSFFWTTEKTHMLGDDYLYKAENIKKLLAQNGMTCYQTHAPMMNEEFPWNEDNAIFRGFIRALEYSAVIGAKCMVVHTLQSPNDNGDVSMDLNIRFFRSFIPYCRKFGVKIAIENLFEGDPKTNLLVERIGSPERINHILDVLGDEYFTFCLDVGHANVCGIDPVHILENVPKRITALHIQDGSPQIDQHLLPYQGKICWERVLAALKAYNFTGAFNMEVPALLFNQPMELVPEALAFAAKVGRYMMKQIQ